MLSSTTLYLYCCYQYKKVDLQMTRDGHSVLFHDENKESLKLASSVFQRLTCDWYLVDKIPCDQKAQTNPFYRFHMVNGCLYKCHSCCIRKHHLYFYSFNHTHNNKTTGFIITFIMDSDFTSKLEDVFGSPCRFFFDIFVVCNTIHLHSARATC